MTMIMMKDIAAAACDEFGIQPPDLISRRRTRTIAHARQSAMWVAREVTDYTLAEVGDHFGRHHSTVLWAVNSVLANDRLYARARAIRAEVA